MKISNKIKRNTGKKSIICFALVLTTLSGFAQNIFDSDLSNQAGSNQNWQNVFWFFVCVAFLVAVAVIGSQRKYIRINRNYRRETNNKH